MSLNQAVGQAVVLLGVLGENLFSFLFWLLETDIHGTWSLIPTLASSNTSLIRSPFSAFLFHVKVLL